MALSYSLQLDLIDRKRHTNIYKGMLFLLLKVTFQQWTAYPSQKSSNDVIDCIDSGRKAQLKQNCLFFQHIADCTLTHAHEEMALLGLYKSEKLLRRRNFLVILDLLQQQNGTGHKMEWHADRNNYTSKTVKLNTRDGRILCQ